MLFFFCSAAEKDYVYLLQESGDNYVYQRTLQQSLKSIRFLKVWNMIELR